MAPYRLCVYNLRQDPQEAKAILILDEFLKLGTVSDIVRTDNLCKETQIISKRMLAGLYGRWAMPDPVQIEDQVAGSSSDLLVVETNWNGQAYSTRQLVQEVGGAWFDEFVDLRFENSTNTLISDTQEVCDVGALDGVKAILYTNTVGFEIQHGDESISVTPGDVDLQGAMKEEKKDDMLRVFNIELREGVELRFMFTFTFMFMFDHDSKGSL